MAFLLVEIEKREIMRVADIMGPLKSVYGYFTSKILDDGESIQVASGSGGRARKMRILQRSTRMVRHDL